MKNKILTDVFGLTCGLLIASAANGAIAQSLQNFDTLPILSAAPPPPKQILEKPALPTVSEMYAKPYVPKPYSIEYQAQKDAGMQPMVPQEFLNVKEKTDDTVFAVGPNKGPLRMNYYRVPMNVVALDKKPQNAISSPSVATKPKAKTVWDYFKKKETVSTQQKNRGPWRAIYEDTKTAITDDVPQALADSLPWVDYDRKNVPLEQVLGTVADGLHRASKEDPEWAISLKPELLDLARKMEAMPKPPQYKEEYLPIEKEQNEVGKAFKKRPVWPGAKVTKEEQYRPFALNSQTEKEFGGDSEALVGNVQYDNFDEEKPISPKVKLPSKKAPSKKKH